jgi:hypothetical protein
MLTFAWMLLAQVSSLTSQCDAHRSSSTTTPQTMLDRTPKAHSFEHDQTLYQQKAVLPKTKGTPTNGTLLYCLSISPPSACWAT